jgi:sulfur carrier protein
VATAVNGAFVPRDARAQTRLSPGDIVLVFGAIVGG